MKRILTLFILIIASLTITSCVKPVEEKNFYQSNNSHEQAVIKGRETIENTTVSLIKEKKVQGGIKIEDVRSAVIIKKEQFFSGSTYYAITTAEVAKNKNNFKIYRDDKSISMSIINSSYNDKFDFGIISFKSTLKFNVAEFGNSDNVFEGQNILSIGTSFNFSSFNSFKTGVVTSSTSQNDENYFSHNAATNYGEQGSGVFDIKGKLIGINSYKITEALRPQSMTNIFSHYIALKSNKIENIIKTIDLDADNIITDELFDVEVVNSKLHNKNEMERAINTVYEQNYLSVVKIISANNHYSGLIYKQELNKYYVITTSIQSEAVIYSNGLRYESMEVREVNDFISIVTFEASENLNLYKGKILNNNTEIELLHGQKLVSVGYLSTEYDDNNLSYGTLSKLDYTSNIMMHDLALNYGHQGAPIFNLNGELIGINVSKIEVINTSSGEIPAEGLSYAYNLNDLLDDNSFVGFEKYEFKTDYEEQLVDILDEIIESTATVVTNLGHGSGVIVKKERYDNDQYLYYVLTNHHVIEQSEEITVNLNDKESSYFQATDYSSIKDYDMGIVRFISDKELKVAKSEINNLHSETPINYNIVPGQSIIVVGAPENSNKSGYATTGTLNLEPQSYRYDGSSKNIEKLSLLNDVNINPGNSGGPIFDLNGQLVGIIASKIRPFTTSDGVVVAERFGFGLNINVLSQQMSKFTPSSFKKIVRTPKLGVTISTVTNFKLKNPEYKLWFESNSMSGFIVSSFDLTREAHKHLKVDDVLYEVNGERIFDVSDIRNHTLGLDMGDIVDFTVLRKDVNNNIKEIKVSVPLS